MPHYSNYGGTTYLSAQPEKESFGSFEPREAKLQEASTNDQLIGGKALKWGEISDVDASLRKADDFIKLGDIKGEFQADELTGNFNALNETTNFDPKILGPISGNGVFKPQDIDARGSVIVMDNHFTTGGGGDFITVEGRPRNIWTNGGASTFEDRDRGATVYVDEDVDGFLKLGDIKGELQTTDLRSENRFVIERFASGSAVESFEPLAGMNSFQFNQSARNTADGFRTAGGGKSIVHPEFRLGGNSAPAGTTFITETFEPAVGMNSFGESLNHVLEISGTAGPGGTSFMTGKFDMPTDNIGGSADPGGTSF